MLLPLLLACTPSAPPAPGPEARPDIVLVVIDTLRADHVGIYGHSRPTTPHIDALARSGGWYARAYAQSGWTLASFASLLTGRMPHEHRVVRDGRDPTRYGHLSPEVQTLAESLEAVGYATGAVLNNTFLAPEFGLNQGFSSWDWKGADNGSHRSADESVSAALRWMEAQKAPRFLLLHLMEPHMGYAPPEDVRGTFASKENPPIPLPFLSAEQIGAGWAGQRRPPPSAEVQDYVSRLYDEEIFTADRAVGRLVEGLRAGGRLEETVLVITADHGEEHWEHGGFEHGHALTGELVRVPLVVSGGPARGEIKAVVEHVDLYQGLLGLAGAARPEGTRGDDLFAPGFQGSPALSENCLYGPDRAAIVDGTHRLSVDLLQGSGEVWAVAADGSERTRLQGPDQAREGDRLLPLLQAARGGLAPIDAGGDTRIPSAEAFQQLEALGYLERGETP